MATGIDNRLNQSEFKPSRRKIEKVLGYLKSNGGEVGKKRNSTHLAGELGFAVHGDNTHHEDDSDAYEVAEWMVENNFIVAKHYDDQGKLSEIALPQEEAPEGERTVDPLVSLLAKAIELNEELKHQINENHDSDEALSDLAKEVEILRAQSKNDQKRIAELENRPSNEDLLFRVSELEKNLEHEQHSNASNKIRIQQTTEQLEKEIVAHSATKDRLSSAHAQNTELLDIISQIKEVSSLREDLPLNKLVESVGDNERYFTKEGIKQVREDLLLIAYIMQEVDEDAHMPIRKLDHLLDRLYNFDSNENENGLLFALVQIRNKLKDIDKLPKKGRKANKLRDQATQEVDADIAAFQEEFMKRFGVESA